MVLEKLKRLITSPPELDPYEEELLEKEHRRISREVERLEGRLDTVQCASCVNKEETHANRIIAQKRALRKTLDDIEWKLGYVPEAKSKRASRP